MKQLDGYDLLRESLNVTCFRLNLFYFSLGDALKFATIK